VFDSSVDTPADHCQIHTDQALIPVVDTDEVDQPDNCAPTTDSPPVECSGTPKQHVISLLDSIYLQLDILWFNFLARLRVSAELLFLWPRLLLIELPRFAISGSILIITVSWLSTSLILDTLLKLLNSLIAWIILACYLCVFSLQATWITLRNVAVARHGQLTIREVFDSISGNRAPGRASQ
jgi:hypothetical protein